MGGRGGELVARNEATVVAKSLFDAIVMKNGQCDGSLANPTGTNESDRGDVLYESDYFLNQLVACEEDPGWWMWQFREYARCKCKTLNPFMIEISDLFSV